MEKDSLSKFGKTVVLVDSVEFPVTAIQQSGDGRYMILESDEQPADGHHSLEVHLPGGNRVFAHVDVKMVDGESRLYRKDSDRPLA